MSHQLHINPIFAAFALCSSFLLPTQAQDTGYFFGIPNNSPGIFWPRGMSQEALSPSNLYPNGTNFGLGTTAGGFGMAGSGPISGVGLAQRAVSNLVQIEMERPYTFFGQQTERFASESARSSAIFGAALGTGFRTEMQSRSERFSRSPLQTTIPSPLPSVDVILNDSLPSTDAVLKTNF